MKLKDVLYPMLHCRSDIKRKENYKRECKKAQPGSAAFSLLNSRKHPPLIQPDTANFGIIAWNENQYLFWAWTQSDCTLGRAWQGPYFQWSVSEVIEIFQCRALKTRIQLTFECFLKVHRELYSPALLRPIRRGFGFLYVFLLKNPWSWEHFHKRFREFPWPFLLGQKVFD